MYMDWPTTLERRHLTARLSKDGAPTHDSRKTAPWPTTLERHGALTHDSRKTAPRPTTLECCRGVNCYLFYFKDQLEKGTKFKDRKIEREAPTTSYSTTTSPNHDSRKAPSQATTTLESHRPEPRQPSKDGASNHDLLFPTDLWTETPLIWKLAVAWWQSWGWGGKLEISDFGATGHWAPPFINFLPSNSKCERNELEIFWSWFCWNTALNLILMIKSFPCERSEHENFE